MAWSFGSMPNISLLSFTFLPVSLPVMSTTAILMFLLSAIAYIIFQSIRMNLLLRVLLLKSKEDSAREQFLPLLNSAASPCLHPFFLPSSFLSILLMEMKMRLWSQVHADGRADRVFAYPHHQSR